MNHRHRTLMVEVICVLLAGVFLYAVASKATTDRVTASGVLPGVHAFAANIADQQVVPPSAALIVARTVLATETVLALWLLFRIRMRAALFTALAVVGLFSGYLVLSYALGSRAPCGCLGRIGGSTLFDSLLRNAGLLFVGVTGIWLLKPPSPTPVGAASPRAAENPA